MRLHPATCGKSLAVEETNTLADIEVDVARERRAAMARTAVLGVFTVFVLAGLLGLFGVRSSTATARDGDLELAVEHPTRARGGLAVPFEILVRREGGFTDPITVSIPHHYLRMFDENGIHPDADQATADVDHIIWTFDPPEADSLLIRFDVRIEIVEDDGGFSFIEYPPEDPDSNPDDPSTGADET